MSIYKLSKKSWNKLHGVHPDLVYIVSQAIKITEVDFMVLEGVRTKERQLELYNSGASKTMNSRHLSGHAVDLGAVIDGRLSWDWPLYDKIAEAMFIAEDNISLWDSKLTWGGNWKTFKDGPHFELPWEEYPKAREDE